MAEISEQLQRWQGEMGERYSIMEKKLPDTTRARVASEIIHGIVQPLSVLEVGSSTGEQSLLLYDTWRNTKFVCLDPSRDAVQIGQKRFPQFIFIRGYALDLPFADNSFDLVFTAGVLMHIPKEEIQQSIEQLFRVARKYVVMEEYTDDVESATGFYGYPAMLFLREYNVVKEGWEQIACQMITQHSHTQKLWIYEKKV